MEGFNFEKKTHVIVYMHWYTKLLKLGISSRMSLVGSGFVRDSGTRTMTQRRIGHPANNPH